jgi:hypothetical protein
MCKLQRVYARAAVGSAGRWGPRTLIPVAPAAHPHLLFSKLNASCCFCCCCCCRDDIPLAAVDFHVAPALTEHLLAQQQLQAAVRTAASTSTPIAAQLTGLGAASLVNSTLWLFRSSYNRKFWLQERYQQQQQQAGGYAQQVGGCKTGFCVFHRWGSSASARRKAVRVFVSSSNHRSQPTAAAATAVAAAAATC